MRLIMTGLLMLWAMLAAVPPSHADTAKGYDIKGTGATFPQNIYNRWILNYLMKQKVMVKYDAIGSGGGIKAITAGDTDFGASDAPLKGDELKEKGLIQFPMILGGITPAINVPGVADGQLKLTGPVLAQIYLGKINNWNDSQIAALNPGLTLPDLPIRVFHRAGGSGTSWVFTKYLDQVSREWHEKVGAGKKVDWPVGNAISTNADMAKAVVDTSGAIAYVEYSYAKLHRLASPSLKNSHGSYVRISPVTIQKAADHAKWEESDGNYMELVNQEGAQSWPITAVSYILVRKDISDWESLKKMNDYFAWCLSAEGAAYPESMGFVHLPERVAELSKSTWRDQFHL